jgi:site-specific DNA-methyltransferase (adenine-specific)
MRARVRPYFDRDGITIYHGDCTKILPSMAGESVDFVLTDPPYLVRYKGRWELGQEQIVGDDDPSWLMPSFAEIWRVLKPDSLCVSFYGWPHSDLFVGVWKALGFRLVSHLAFVKRVWGLGRFTRSQHETAYLLAKGRPPVPAEGIADVIEWQREPDAFHPNQKPAEALHPLLATFAREGGIVLDPFMGSGSTLRAAKDFGLRAIGIEIEQKFCQGAVERMAQGVLFPLPFAAEPKTLPSEALLPLPEES